MIQSKADYKEYLKADEKANSFSFPTKYVNVVRKYLRCLRKIEYLTNCKKRSLLARGGGISL